MDIGSRFRHRVGGLRLPRALYRVTHGHEETTRLLNAALRRSGPAGSDDFFRYDHDGHATGATGWLIATVAYARQLSSDPVSSAARREIGNHINLQLRLGQARYPVPATSIGYPGIGHPGRHLHVRLRSRRACDRCGSRSLARSAI